MRLLSFISLFLCSLTSYSQDSLLTVSGFIDLYYAYDFNKPSDKYRQYTTQPARHNELNLNWAFVKIDYAKQLVRSSFALHTGTFVIANYGNEPEMLRNIYQASAGYKLYKTIWIDVGIMPSHIGMESAVSIENWNYSRNIQSDYSPYYQAGVHISVGLSEKVKMKFALLNGFQIIRENNDAKSVGLLISYYPNKNWELGYSNYFGNEAPSDSILIAGTMQKLPAKRRFFNNLFLRGQLSEKIGIAFVGEYNLQERFVDTKTRNWYNVLAIAKYNIAHQWSLACRAELFYDRDQFVVSTGTDNGFQVHSYTVTLNYYPVETLAFRIEGRTYQSKDAIYVRSISQLTRTSSFVAASIAVKF